MTEIVVEDIVVPRRIEDADAADFIVAQDIVNETEREGYGTDELAFAAAEVLPPWQSTANPHRMFGVRADGELIARGALDWLVADPASAWIRVLVRKEHRNRGVGTALLDHIEQRAREAGHEKLIGYAVSGDAPGPRLEAPTGFGSVPAENAEVRFLLAHGYRLEQVERGSRLALPFREPVPEAPEGYRLHYWVRPTPPEWREDMAHLYTRMSTDAPSAGLEEPEDVWTVERLLEHEERASRSPRTKLFAAVEHIASGRLAGFTVLWLPPELERPAMQDDTLALREHRGHGLGMLLKRANLAFLDRERPGHPSVITFNAEENRFMLDINEAIGFVPMGYEGAWRKDL